jgi:hypothetical protein
MMKQGSLDVPGGTGVSARTVPLSAGLSQQDRHRRSQDGNVRQSQLVERGREDHRDASLIFYGEEIASYLADVYDYDCNRLATAHPAHKQPRVARDGEEAPRGFRRVPFLAVFED